MIGGPAVTVFMYDCQLTSVCSYGVDIWQNIYTEHSYIFTPSDIYYYGAIFFSNAL